MNNLEVRIIVSDLGLTYKKIAERMGLTPVHLSRLMRKELTPENKGRILKAVYELRATRGEESAK